MPWTSQIGKSLSPIFLSNHPNYFFSLFKIFPSDFPGKFKFSRRSVVPRTRVPRSSILPISQRRQISETTRERDRRSLRDDVSPKLRAFVCGRGGLGGRDIACVLQTCRALQHSSMSRFRECNICSISLTEF